MFPPLSRARWQSRASDERDGFVEEDAPRGLGQQRRQVHHSQLGRHHRLDVHLCKNNEERTKEKGKEKKKEKRKEKEKNMKIRLDFIPDELVRP